jgi:phosphocarrier protein HPr
MVSRQVTIVSDEGIQAQDASLLVQIASRFSSRISIEHGNRVVNAKSMMGVFSLGATRGEKLMLVFEGEDERQAADALVKFIESGFAG